jgi:multiple sugar transport system ATP-binding protein
MFVAGFIGSPAMNMLEATVAPRDGATTIIAGEVAIELSEATLAAHPALEAYDSRTIVLGIRPEGLNDAALPGVDGQLRFRARAELREALGPEVLMHFSIDARPAVTDEIRELAEDVGDDRVVEPLRPLERTTLVGRFGAQTRMREGDTIEVAVDQGALHFFDPATGRAIAEKAAVSATV